jgi:Trypsin-like peptidase domain
MRINVRAISPLLLIVVVSSFSPARSLQELCVRVESSTLHWFPPSIRSEVGTGICIGEQCSVVLTPYHMQLAAGKASLEVIGGQVGKVLSAATTTNADTSEIRLGNKMVSYNVGNDFSFLVMKRKVRHKTRAVPHYRPNVGDLVYVAGYYGRKFQIQKTRLIGVNVPLMIGQSELRHNLVLDVELMPGSSGSAVLDKYNRLLGMIVVTGKLKLQAGSLSGVSVALPIQSIAARLVSLDPALGSALFADIPHEQPNNVSRAAVIYEELELPDNASAAIPTLSPVHGNVPNAVNAFQQKAAIAAKTMINVLAEQCMVQGTATPKCYEVSLIDGDQTYREIRHNRKLGKQMSQFPTPRAGVWFLSEWANTLAMIPGGSWTFEGLIGEKYLFARTFGTEGDQCEYEEHSSVIPLFGGGYGDWQGLVPCTEQVVTDKAFNVLADFLEVTPPPLACKFRILQSAIYFSWVTVDGVTAPMLLPTSERINGKVEGRNRLMYTTVSWAKYRKFGSEHKIRLPQRALLRRP